MGLLGTLYSDCENTSVGLLQCAQGLVQGLLLRGLQGLLQCVQGLVQGLLLRGFQGLLQCVQAVGRRQREAPTAAGVGLLAPTGWQYSTQASLCEVLGPGIALLAVNWRKAGMLT